MGKHRHDTSRDQRRSQFSSHSSQRRGTSWTWVIGGATALFVASIIFAGKGGPGRVRGAACPPPDHVRRHGRDLPRTPSAASLASIAI